MDQHDCEACREPGASQRCTGCRKVWYCNKECQTSDWVSHIFKCNPRRPINTADHLALAVRQDLLPTDLQTLKEWGFDKAQLFPPDGPFKLFGLYVGLIQYCDVKPMQLHKWRLQGRLIPEIKAVYEAIPAHARGGYYPWFLEHQSVLEEPETEPEESKALIEDLERRAWTALGKPPTAPRSAILEYLGELPMDHRVCFFFYGGLLLSTYPSPPTDQYIQFGFCVCPTQYEEMNLTRAYIALLKACTFDDFCDAYSSGTLLDLFANNGVAIPSEQAYLLADVFAGSRPDESMKSVWNLKQWVASGCEGSPHISVAVDYGFFNCSDQEDRRQLITLYKTFFESPHSDPIKLHEACAAGRLLHFFTEEVKMTLPGSRQLFQRLLKNTF